MNVSDLGQDREHCQQLHRQLRKLRGVWAGVRCPASGNSDPAWALEPEAGPRQLSAYDLSLLRQAPSPCRVLVSSSLKWGYCFLHR